MTDHEPAAPDVTATPPAERVATLLQAYDKAMPEPRLRAWAAQLVKLMRGGRRRKRTPPPPFDVEPFIGFNPCPFGTWWESHEGSRRRGWRGQSLGTLFIKNTATFAVVLRMEDGTIETFSPGALAPSSDQASAGSV